MGLIFAAMTGYDPQNAIPFWQRMAASSQGAPMEFMSSHPSDATRIRNIQKWMPEAMKYYQNGQSKESTTIQSIHIGSGKQKRARNR